MESIDEKIGYLMAKMEEQGNDLRTLTVKVDALKNQVEEKFKTVEATFRVLRWLGLITVAVLTLKFGDVPRIWISLFG